MAFTEVPSSWGHKEIITQQFSNSLKPKEEDNYAFCQVINFTNPYFSPPSIVLTASHVYDSSNVNAVPPEHNSIVAWNEEVTKTYFRACVKDLVGLQDKHHPITVDYLIFGDLDPCINKKCDYFAQCQPVAPRVTQCVCISKCPTYEDLVCATNGQTFDNMCIMKRDICRTKRNITYYHPGGCQGFPLDKGRHLLHQQDYPWSDTHCEVVLLKPYTFYPDKPLHVQLTVNYIKALQTTKVHEATVTWTENVNTDNFTACITRTGRNDNPSYDRESVDWIAYQGAPNGGVTGRERFTTWWTGTTCRTVSFPMGKFSSSPTVLVTPEHQRRGLKHDAASVWVEDVGSLSFKLCLRELQNFDGVHEDIDVNWMAFEILHRPLFSEHGNVSFPNDYTPRRADNYAFCKTVEMVRNYTKQPIVMVTPTHRTGAGRTNPQCNGISAWIESMTSRNFRVCMKELYVNQYDPVTMQYAIVSDICGDGWTYFNGFCYLTNTSCTTWQAAQSSCLIHNANLTSITNHEENIYVQHRHGGETGWIGLQNLQSNGTFTWIDGNVVNFTNWAQNRPNRFLKDQNCVHTLGLRRGYQWNDVRCSSCHAYSCKRDLDECSTGAHNCDVNASCTNTIGSFTCQCNGQACDLVDLRFPRRSTADYVIIKGIPTMTAVTLCYWMKTADTGHEGTVFSYAVKGIDEPFLLIDYRTLSLFSNTDETGPTGGSANDGRWHHICLSWSNTNGSWAIYKDGTSTAQDSDLSTGDVLPGGGTLIIGQEQDVERGGFKLNQSFTGDVTGLNIWNRALEPSEISQMSRACPSGEGNVLRWRDVTSGTFRGQVQIIRPSASCSK